MSDIKNDSDLKPSDHILDDFLHEIGGATTWDVARKLLGDLREAFKREQESAEPTPVRQPSDAAVEAFRDWVDPSEDIGEIEFMQRIRSGLEAAYRVDAPRPLLDREAAIKHLGGSELAAATVDHLLSADLMRPMPTRAELAYWLCETFTADTGGTSWDLAAECILIALNGGD